MDARFELETSKAVAPLRTAVLRPNRTPTDLLFYDEDSLPTTVHGAVYLDDQIVAVATFMHDRNPVTELNAIRLRGMAVSPEFQKRGFGGIVLTESLKALRARFTEIETVWCNARLTAVAFYESHGFATHGSQFEIADIGPHYVMWRKL